MCLLPPVAAGKFAMVFQTLLQFSVFQFDIVATLLRKAAIPNLLSNKAFLI
jgi:hypothetical protein